MSLIITAVYSNMNLICVWSRRYVYFHSPIHHDIYNTYDVIVLSTELAQQVQGAKELNLPLILIFHSCQCKLCIVTCLELGKVEDEIFKTRREKDLNFKRRNKEKRRRNTVSVVTMVT